MRGTFVYRDGEMVPKHLAAPLITRGPRSDVACPMLIRDQMEPLQSMLDGRLYESKSELRASYKAGGVRELGNDAPTEAKQPGKPDGLLQDIGRAYQKVREGYKPEATFERLAAETGWTEPSEIGGIAETIED